MAAPLAPSVVARIQANAARRLAERAEQAIRDAAEAKAATEALDPEPTNPGESVAAVAKAKPSKKR